MKKLLSLVFLFVASSTFAVGTTTVAKTRFPNDAGQYRGALIDKYVVTFVADASTGAVPTANLGYLSGILRRVYVINGSTAPTNLWDVSLLEATTGSADVLGLQLNDLSNAANSNIVIQSVVKAGTLLAMPFYLAGNYTMTIAGTTVNSATGTIVLYVER